LSIAHIEHSFKDLTMNTPAIHNLPDEVKALSTFVLWVAVSDKAGATGKRPFDPWYKGRGNDDPTLHSLLPQALRTLQALPNKKLGLGLFQPAGGVRLGADGKSGYLHIIDLDGFVGPVSTAGKIKLLDLGWDIVELCQGSYFEVSPSGNGAKILMVSDLEPASKTSLALLKNERVPRRSGRSAKTVSKGSPHPQPRPHRRGAPRRRTGSGARRSKALPGRSPQA
jgi:hypothetical protein